MKSDRLVDTALSDSAARWIGSPIKSGTAAVRDRPNHLSGIKTAKKCRWPILRDGPDGPPQDEDQCVDTPKLPTIANLILRKAEGLSRRMAAKNEFSGLSPCIGGSQQSEAPVSRRIGSSPCLERVIPAKRSASRDDAAR